MRKFKMSPKASAGLFLEKLQFWLEQFDEELWNKHGLSSHTYAVRVGPEESTIRVLFGVKTLELKKAIEFDPPQKNQMEFIHAWIQKELVPEIQIQELLGSFTDDNTRRYRASPEHGIKFFPD